MAALVCLSFVFYGYEETFELWGIPTLRPEFADLRTITAASESLEQGFDPLKENPYDPWQRQMNYPRIWLLTSYIGLDQSDTIYIGITFITLFFIALLLFFRQKFQLYQIIICLAVIFSPSVMLTIERGNNDMLMFFLIAISIYFVSKNSAFSKLFSFFLISIAFILKLFPIFAIIIFIREKGYIFLRFFISILLIAFVYVVLTFSDLILIFQNTPKEPYSSYGMNVLWQATKDLSSVLASIFQLISYILIASTILIFRFGFRIKNDISSQNLSMQDGGFLAGSAIYLGTFIIGSNFDYRLIFLIFTIPAIINMIGSAKCNISKIASISLVLILVSLWHLYFSDKLFILTGRSFPALIIDEIANWLLFFSLSFLFAYMLPDKLKDNILLKKILRL
jgi:hypothetical protein